MATLASSVIDRILRKLRKGSPATSLTTTVNTSITSFVLASTNGVGAGQVMEIESELVRVTAVDHETKTATVVRAVQGSTAAAHNSGVEVYTNPEFTRIEVLDHINDCLDDLFPTVFKLGSETLTYSSSVIGLNVSIAGSRPVAVLAETNKSAKLWEPIADWRFETNLDTADFTSGRALMIRTALESNARIRVIMAQPFAQVSAESDDLEADVGLTTYMTDLPFFYTVGYMMPERELTRSKIEASQNHQRAQDVPSFLALRTGDWYMTRYREALERARIRQGEEVSRVRMSGYGS